MSGPKVLKRESTKRLRQCLTALAETAGSDVFRAETVVTGNRVRLFVTCSREMSEKAIATEIGSRLYQLLHPASDDVDPRDSVSLSELREAIDHHLGWSSVAQEAAGDYVSRVREVGEQLNALGVVTLSSVRGP